MAFIKSLTKAEAKVLRDLGVAKDDFLLLDDYISSAQIQNSHLTAIEPNCVVYKTAVEEFRKPPLQYTILDTDVGQPQGKTKVTSISWNA